MVAQPASSRAWRVIALSGIGLTVVGIGAGYLDDSTHSFEFISDYFETFALAGLLGVILSFVGLIGWTRRLGKEQRVLTALSVFISPWIILLLSYLTVGLNFHGAAAPVIMLIFPATVLAFVLLVTPAAKIQG
jgi:hypothetical protein